MDTLRFLLVGICVIATIQGAAENDYTNCEMQCNDLNRHCGNITDDQCAKDDWDKKCPRSCGGCKACNVKEWVMNLDDCCSENLQEIDTLKARLEYNISDVATKHNQSQIGFLRDIVVMNETVNSLNDEIASLQSTCEEDIAELESAIDDLNDGQVTTNANDISGLTTTLSGLSAGTSGQVKTNKASIASLSTQVTSLGSYYTTLYNSHNTLYSTVSTLQTKVNGLRQLHVQSSWYGGDYNGQLDDSGRRWEYDWVWLSGFYSAPKVMLSVRKMDASRDHNLRYDLYADSIAYDRFRIVRGKWSDTKIHQMDVSWLAIGLKS